MTYIIRRAIKSDARGIHEAHMRSIEEICSKYYSEKEISAWGRRPFDQVKKEHVIENDIVFVVELDGKIEGFAQLMYYAPKKYLGLIGLYITPSVVGLGFGKGLLKQIIEEARKLGGVSINCCSTINAKDFYQYQGFITVEDNYKILIGDVPIPSVLMSYPLIDKNKINNVLKVEVLEKVEETILEVSNFLYRGFGHLYEGSSPEKYKQKLRIELEESKEIPKTFVAYLDSVPIGTAGLYNSFGGEELKNLSPWFGSLYVTPEYRRNGIAEFVFQQVVNYLQSSNYSKIYLHTPEEERLYASWGWKVVEVYQNSGKAEKIMEYNLCPTTLSSPHHKEFR